MRGKERLDCRPYVIEDGRGIQHINRFRKLWIITGSDRVYQFEYIEATESWHTDSIQVNNNNLLVYYVKISVCIRFIFMPCESRRLIQARGWPTSRQFCFVKLLCFWKYFVHEMFTTDYWAVNVTLVRCCSCQRPITFAQAKRIDRKTLLCVAKKRSSWNDLPIHAQ